MEIYDIALDIKVPEDGPIKILEIMGAHIAGRQGYVNLYGEDIWDKFTFPYLEDLADEAAMPIVLRQKPYPLHDMGRYPYGFEAAEKGKGLIYPAPYYYTSRTELDFAARNPSYVLVNGNIEFLAAEQNKAVQSLIIEEEKNLKDYFPPSAVLPCSYWRGITEDIMERIGEHDYYVIKPVDQKRGIGITTVHKEKLDSTLEELLVTKRKFKSGRFTKNYWACDINPVFIVQPYIASAPVMKNGKKFDGTMRVFMSLHKEKHDTDFTCQVHDGYWKLPLKPLPENDTVGNHHLKSHVPSFSLSARFSRAAGLKFARLDYNNAKINSDTANRVFSQLKTVIPDYINAITSEGLGTRINRWLYSGDPALQGTAAMMALHPLYFAASVEKPLTESDRHFPAAFAERLNELGRPDTANCKPSTIFSQYFSIRASKRKPRLATPVPFEGPPIHTYLMGLQRPAILYDMPFDAPEGAVTDVLLPLRQTTTIEIMQKALGLAEFAAENAARNEGPAP